MDADPATLARIAHDEGLRRSDMWRDLVAQHQATDEQAEADELVWYEMEMFFRWRARQPGVCWTWSVPTTPLETMAKAARRALTKLLQRHQDPDAQICRHARDLHQLTVWLETCFHPRPQRQIELDLAA